MLQTAPLLLGSILGLTALASLLQSGPRDPREDTAHCPLNSFKPVQQLQTTPSPLVSISRPTTEADFSFKEYILDLGNPAPASVLEARLVLGMPEARSDLETINHTLPLHFVS